MLLPQPLIHHMAKPYKSKYKESDQNMPKYVLEASNSARLIALNNPDKTLATFLSATETVGLDEDTSCQDPIRLAYTFTMTHSLRNAPNPYLTSDSARCHLP